MSKTRLIFFILLLISGLGITGILYFEKATTPYKSTFTSLFQVAGKVTKNVNRVLTKVLPVDSIDEGELGAQIAQRYRGYTNTNSKDYKYLNDILANFAVFKKKPFKYQGFIMNSQSPNAFALPGGVIVVTSGLLSQMKNESEVIGIIAHEMGHIERSHCLDAVKFQLLFKKIKSPTLGKIIDVTISLMARHSFSKTQETEADEYAFELVLNTEYDPAGFGNAFKNIKKYSDSKNPSGKKEKKSNIVKDYFASHPLIKNRIEKYSEKARVWKKSHSKKRYVGIKNLNNRITFYQKKYSDEWTVSSNDFWDTK